MIIAVIPARGGSKRIPRKNIRDFAGKPMIAYSIECAKRSALFDHVIVSTDDAEISRIALEYGAEVPFVRPANLSDDHTGTTDVVAHAIDWYRQNGVPVSRACCIYPTAPFVEPEDLKEGLRLMNSGQWRYVFAATKLPGPVLRSFQQLGGGGIEMLFPQHFSTRSQDLPDVLYDAGQFYWGDAEAWLERARVFERHSTIVSIPAWRAKDIDTEEDWQQAEAMIARIKAQPETASKRLT
ncbi:MAG TPA: pseudaminic acid cytidylyltransferase [Steroidobacteraceae bacterium]